MNPTLALSVGGHQKVPSRATSVGSEVSALRYYSLFRRARWSQERSQSDRRLPVALL
jgi:hypothetical protein